MKRIVVNLNFIIVWLVLPWMALAYLLLVMIRRKQVPLPPGPFPLPVVGNLFEFEGKHHHKCLAKLAQTHGPIMKLRLSHQTIVVVSSASMAKEVLGKNDSSVASRPMGDVMRAHLHHDFSLVCLPVGSRWRSLREVCNAQMFSSRSLEASQHIRQKKVEELLCYVSKCCKDRVAVDIGQVAFTTTLNFLCYTLFSVDLAGYESDTCRDLKQLIWEISVETSKPNLVDFYPMLRTLDPQGIRRRMETLFSQFMDIIANVIPQRSLEPPRAPGLGRHYSDLLDALLQENSVNLNHSNMLHIFMDLIVAGTESTSGMVEWTLAELLRHPSKLTRAKAELQQAMAIQNSSQEINMSKLPYLEAIIKEVFRLHPIVPVLPRQVDSVIKVGGYRVPKNSRIWINMYAMGRDSRVWENPDSFEPERFIRRDIEDKVMDFELIPFGGGRRICPALPLAMKMVPLILGALVHSFDWKLEDGADPQGLNMDDKLGVTLLKAHPLRVIPVRDD